LTHRVVLSCEHGGNEVPPRYAACFDGAAGRAALAGHRGWDPGSLELAVGLADELDAPLVVQRVTRLLVECNRSADHPRLWSELSAPLPPDERRRILARYWTRHRDAVRRAVTAGHGATVIHVGVHTFTPVWAGRPRTTDVGILYDPARPAELGLARAWQRLLRTEPAARGLTVHRNRPYRGWTDGLTTTLRSELPPSRYLGLELEVSQGLVPVSSALVEALADSLRTAIAEARGRPYPPKVSVPNPASAHGLHT